MRYEMRITNRLRLPLATGCLVLVTGYAFVALLKWEPNFTAWPHVLQLGVVCLASIAALVSATVLRLFGADD